MRDLSNSVHAVRAISPAAAIANNAPVISETVNTSGYDMLVFLILTGVLAAADASFTVLVQHATKPDFSDAAEVPDAGLTGTEASASFTSADDNKVRKIGYVGGKQYVRLTVTPANNAAAASIAAVALLSGARQRPTPSQS